MNITNDSGFALRIPKVVARVKMLGGAFIFEINEDTPFVMPTEEQKKNLKEMLTIEVESVDEDLKQGF